MLIPPSQDYMNMSVSNTTVYLLCMCWLRWCPWDGHVVCSQSGHSCLPRHNIRGDPRHLRYLLWHWPRCWNCRCSGCANWMRYGMRIIAETKQLHLQMRSNKRMRKSVEVFVLLCAISPTQCMMGWRPFVHACKISDCCCLLVLSSSASSRPWGFHYYIGRRQES
jgi:hypothetical protein